MSPVKTFFVILGGITLVIVFFAYQLLKSPYLDRDISGSVTISSEWAEITPAEPLKPEREMQEVVLEFGEPVTPLFETYSVRLRDGSIAKPEVQLVDANGNVFKLDGAGLGNTDMIFYMRQVAPHEEGLPNDRTYRAVRIRSDRPFKLSRVYWRCYNPWDRK